ncbi:MAG: sensor histidine kinase [Gammaproteobacteria bacterium]
MAHKRRNTTDSTSYEANFLPDFCSARTVLLAVLSAELLAFILALSSGADGRDLWINLALISVFLQWIALGNIVVLCLSRPRLNRLTPLAAALGCYGLSLVVTLAVSVCAVWFAPLDLVAAGNGLTLHQQFIQRNVAIGAIVSAVALRYFYVQHQWKQNIETEARSRIQALQARIRPHFLFNSMNTIASLTRTSPELAEKAVEDLADLFRGSLGQQDIVTLEQELEFVRRYINIEQLRLGDRLTVEWRVEDDVDTDAKVPALVLQPLMENAIYHGIEPLPAGGVVNLRIVQHKGRIKIAIEGELAFRFPGRAPAALPGEEVILAGKQHCQPVVELR